jgi:hypothetical protein
MTITINGWAVVAAVAANFVVGGLWYSPALFLKPWMRMAEVSKPVFDAGLPKALLGDFISACLIAITLAAAMRFANVEHLLGGLVIAFWLWLGLVATALLSSVTYEHRPWGFFAINAGYRLVTLMIMGVIFSLWR